MLHLLWEPRSLRGNRGWLGLEVGALSLHFHPASVPSMTAGTCFQWSFLHSLYRAVIQQTQVALLPAGCASGGTFFPVSLDLPVQLEQVL